ncbi:MAG: hypothetical protein ABIQ32_06640 [Sphingomicrobium sp.]
MMKSQADAIRGAIAKVLKVAQDTGAVEVTFRAEDVSQAVVGTISSHPNVISALTSGKMEDQTGFSPGIVDRDYKSSAALISFKL